MIEPLRVATSGFASWDSRLQNTKLVTKLRDSHSEQDAVNGHACKRKSDLMAI